MKNRKAARSDDIKILFYRMMILVVFCFFAVILLWYISPRNTMAEKKIKEETALTGVLIYEEFVVYSDYRGKVTHSNENGDKIAKDADGAILASAMTSLHRDNMTFSLKAPFSGLLFYGTDGLESVLTPSMAKDISIGQIIENQNKYPFVPTDSQVKGGVPVYKVVNNQKPLFLATSMEKELWHKPFTKGESYSLRIDGVIVQGTLERYAFVKDDLEVVFSLPPQDDLFKKRFAKIEILL